MLGRKPKVLLIDDDASLRRALICRLGMEGYAVNSAEGSTDGLLLARRDPPDLALLDIGLPDGDGREVARTLQREMNVPIIFLTARSDEMDVVVGLEMGAEDYITKPFRLQELLARIRVVLRRKVNPALQAQSEMFSAGGITLNVARHEVHAHGGKVDLPPKEFEMLRLLMANAPRALSSDYLLNAIWGEEFTGSQQVLYVHMGWLRERIEVDPRSPRLIQTVHGIGYRFSADGDGDAHTARSLGHHADPAYACRPAVARPAAHPCSGAVLYGRADSPSREPGVSAAEAHRARRAGNGLPDIGA
jgi:two-component system, OmpR family, response regulator RegX3